MHIIFEHRKEDVTLIRIERRQAMAMNIDFFEDARKQPETLA